MTESPAPTTSPSRSKTRMRSVMTLELHSDIAHDYVRSHIPPDPDAKSQPGLEEFARQVRGVYTDASHDNPFADWTLLKIEDDIKALRDAIAEARKDLKDKLEAIDAIDVETATRAEPHRDQLEFDTPYAHVLGVALREFDELVREGMTAAHVGVIRPRERTALFQDMTSRLRRIIMAPHHYPRNRITRATYDEDARQIETLESRLGGSVPEDVLSGKRRGEFAPDLVVGTLNRLTN